MSSGGAVPPHAGYGQMEAAARQAEHGQDRPQAQPSGFAVSATASGGGRARGELLVSPGSIVFSPFNASGDFAHQGRSITMTNVWLWPPWADTFLVLHHERSSLLIAAPAFVRGKLKRALQESGFKLVQQTSWRAPRLPR